MSLKMRVVEIKKKIKNDTSYSLNFNHHICLIDKGQLKMTCLPILSDNLPYGSKITHITIINGDNKIRVDAIVKPDIKHQGFFNIPDNYTLEIFCPKDEKVVVFFWYDERNIIFIDNYDCEQSLRVSRDKDFC